MRLSLLNADAPILLLVICMVWELVSIPSEKIIETP